MFTVNEADAAVIREAFTRGGELSAVVELRRLFPGLIDNGHARLCARKIAGWRPRAPSGIKVTQLGSDMTAVSG